MALQKVLGGLIAVTAATVGIGLASPASADPPSCETVGGSTVCGQGRVSSGLQSAKSGKASAPSNGDTACTTPYGNYQRC